MNQFSSVGQVFKINLEMLTFSQMTLSLVEVKFPSFREWHSTWKKLSSFMFANKKGRDISITFINNTDIKPKNPLKVNLVPKSKLNKDEIFNLQRKTKPRARLCCGGKITSYLYLKSISKFSLLHFKENTPAKFIYHYKKKRKKKRIKTT